MKSRSLLFLLLLPSLSWGQIIPPSPLGIAVFGARHDTTAKKSSNYGKDHYVAPWGNDSWSGNRTDSARLTIASAQALLAGAGHRLLLRSGGIWREQLTVPNSGTAGSPVTIISYGSGSRPEIHGDTVLVANWALADSTFTLGAGTNDATADCDVNRSSPTQNYDHGVFGTNRGAVQFKTNLFPVWSLQRWAIPALAGKTISAVTVSLWQNSGWQTGTPQINVLELGNTPGTTWNEAKANWNTYDTVHAWTAGGLGGGPDGDSIGLAAQKYSGWADGGFTDVAFNAGGVSYVQANRGGNINLMFKANGTANSDAIIFGGRDYATTGDRPKLTITISGGVSRPVYSLTVGTIVNVYCDGVKVDYASGSASGVALNQWDYTGGKLYLNVGGDPSTHLIEAIRSTAAEDGIVVGSTIPGSAKNFVTIDGINIKNVRRWGVQGIATDSLAVKNCTIQNIGPGDGTNDAVGIAANFTTAMFYADNDSIMNIVGVAGAFDTTGGSGIYLGSNYSDHPSHCRDALVQNCYFYNSGNGINAKYGTYRSTFQYNHTYRHRHEGISVVGLDTTLTLKNKIYGNYVDWAMADAGIWVFTKTDIEYNVVVNSFGGIGIVGSSTASENSMNSGDSCNIYNNTLYNDIEALKFYNAGAVRTTGNIIKNNIIHTSTHHVRILEAQDTTANVFDYNYYYQPAGSADFEIDDAGGAHSFTTWKTALGVGQEAHSAEADPKLVNTSTDLSLQNSSPCKNAGVNVSLILDILAHVVPYPTTLVDIGAYEYQGP